MKSDKIPTIQIEDKEIHCIEYLGQRVVTLEQIDRVHHRPDGTARRTFSKHRARFIENEDFFTVPYSEWSKMTAIRNTSGGPTGKISDGRKTYISKNMQHAPIIFFSESGYLLLTKPLRDALAWKIQRQLINFYFRVKAVESAGAQSPPRPPRIGRRLDNNPAPAMLPPPKPQPTPEPESDSVEYWLARHQTGLKLVPLRPLAAALGMNPERLLEKLDPKAFHYLQNKAGVIIPHEAFLCYAEEWHWRNECTGLFVTNFGLRELFGLRDIEANIRTQAMGHLLQDMSPRELKWIQGSVSESLNARYRNRR